MSQRKRCLLSFIFTAISSTAIANTQIDVNADSRGDIIQQWNNNGILWLLPYVSNGAGYAPTNWINTGQGFSSAYRDGPGLLGLDINGDNKSDLVQQWNNNGTLWLLPYITNGTGYVASNWINLGQGFASALDRTPALLALDINGDGKADLVQQWNNNGVLWLLPLISNGSGFTPANWINTGQGYASAKDGTPDLLVIDINGDGKADLIQQWDHNGVLWLLPLISNGIGFEPTNWINTGQNYASAEDGTPDLLVMDINGDGKGDVVQQWKYPIPLVDNTVNPPKPILDSNGNPKYSFSLWLLPYLSNGTSVTPTNWVDTQQGYASGPQSSPGLISLDINGDRKFDLVQQWNNGGILWLLPYLSNGTGFSPTAWINTQQNFASGPGGEPGLRAVDVNGDGKTDLIQQWNNNGQLWLMSYLSTGTGFFAQTWTATGQGYLSSTGGTPALLAGNYLNPVKDEISAHVIGQQQSVYSSGSCTDSSNTPVIPDTPARAFKNNQGVLKLSVSSGKVNLFLSGYSFGGSFTPSCTSSLAPSKSPGYEDQKYLEWIHGLYSDDGQNIYALIHNEYHGYDAQLRAQKCPDYGSPQHRSSPVDTCWKSSTTLAISRDGGTTFSHPTNYRVAWPNYPYDSTKMDPGLSAPTNIIKNDHDGYYYAAIWSWIVNSESGQPPQKKGLCMMRTNNLEDAASWRAWDGVGFNVAFYPAGATCEPIAGNTAPNGMMPTQLVFNTFYKKFMLIGYNSTVYFMLSDDLIHWSTAKKIEGLTWANDGPIANAYAAIYDDADTSKSFERPGKTVYLYYTLFHNTRSQSDSTVWTATNNRELVRVPITFENEP